MVPFHWVRYFVSLFSPLINPPLRGDRIGLASYSYSLDGTTTNNYLAFAASAFDKHSLISTIQVAQSVISESSIFSFLSHSSLFLFVISRCLVACIGPVIAKVADVTSRAIAFLIIRMYLRCVHP